MLTLPTANDLLDAAAVFPTASPASGSVTGVRFADLGGPLSVVHPATFGSTTYDGAVPAPTTTEENSTAFCQLSTNAIRRTIRLRAQSGGGPVLIPRILSADRSRVLPFMYAGEIEIEEGVTLIVEGVLKMIGGLTLDDANGSFADPFKSTRQRKYSNSTITFASDIQYGAITGPGRIDGNARGNIISRTGSDGALKKWTERGSGPAACGCNGVTWGPGGGRVPPAFALIEGVETFDTIRSGFVGSLANVRLAHPRARFALTDHLYYFSDGDNSTSARTRHANAGAFDLDGSGWWQGGAVNTSDGDIKGLHIHDVESNPSGRSAHPTQGGLYDQLPTQRLLAILGPRPYKLGGQVTGLLVQANLGLLENILAFRGLGFHVEGQIYHTGGPHDYYKPDGTVGPDGAPCLIAGIGAPYEHLVATGGSAHLTVRRAPGRTRLFGNRAGPFDGLDLRFALDYHPETTDSGDLVVLHRTGRGLRLHTQAPARALAGGGPRRFVVFRGMGFVGAPEPLTDDPPAGLTESATDLGPPPPEFDASLLAPNPQPPARGFDDVAVSGSVHTERTQDWCAFVVQENENQAETEDTAPRVSRLTARDLTVVSKSGTTSDALARWHHERVAYLVADPAVSGTLTQKTLRVKSAPNIPAPRRDAALLSHGLPGPDNGHGTRPDRLVVRLDTGASPDTKLYGATLDYDDTDKRAVVHFDNAANATPPHNTDVSVLFEAERYGRRRGDVTFDAPVAGTGVAGPYPVGYPADLALVRAPRVWQVVRLDTGEGIRAQPTATGFDVWFATPLSGKTITVQVLARVG